MACEECQAVHQQNLDLRRIVSELAKSLEGKFRLRASENPSLTELVALVEQRPGLSGQWSMMPVQTELRRVPL